MNQKKGIFLPPSLPYGPMSPSQQFFFGGIPKVSKSANSLDWKVIDKGKTFNPITGVCKLCLIEKFHILYNPEASTLNSRDEIFTPCPHKHKFLLSNAHL